MLLPNVNVVDKFPIVSAVWTSKTVVNDAFVVIVDVDKTIEFPYIVVTPLLLDNVNEVEHPPNATTDVGLFNNVKLVDVEFKTFPIKDKTLDTFPIETVDGVANKLIEEFGESICVIPNIEPFR